MSTDKVSKEKAAAAGRDAVSSNYIRMLFFVLPLMLSGILQLMFNTADMVIVGRFAGSTSLAAVGSNGAVINLLVKFLGGLCVGTAVAVAHYYGSGVIKDIRGAIHTSVFIGLWGGIIFGFLGFWVSPLILQLMGAPENVRSLAVLYLRIYFLGMPGISVYNFGSAVLRSMGDSKHPMFYMMTAGVVNVVLNVILVAFFHMDVAGVAVATSISQTLAAVLVLKRLTKLSEDYRFRWQEMRISRDKLLFIMKIGVPAGIQSVLFSLSNVFIQSAVNGFGENAIAGNSSVGNIEGFCLISMSAFCEGCQTFISQDIGGRKYENISPAVRFNMCMMVLCSTVICGMIWLHGGTLLQIFLPTNPAAIEFGLRRIRTVTITYIIGGITEMFSGALRGMEKSFLSMVVSMFGICGFRILWISTVFQKWHELETLYISYPISWVITAVILGICYVREKNRLHREGVRVS